MIESGLSKQIDGIYKELGTWGKWQVGQVVLLYSLSIPAAFQLLSIVFLGYQPDFRCADLAEEDNSKASLSFRKKCVDFSQGNSTTVSSCPRGYEYDDSPGASTLVTEWNLVCDKSYQVQLTQTILIAGQAVGATLFTNLADRYGRKKVVILCQWGLLAFAVGSAFSPTILVFTLLRFPIGAFQQSLVMSFTVLPMEIIPMDQRPTVHVLALGSWACSQSLLVGMAYAYRDYSWKYLQLALCSASLFVVVLQMVFLDESIRWLLANARTTEANFLVKRASRLNNVSVDEKRVGDAASIAGSDYNSISLTSLQLSDNISRNSSNYLQRSRSSLYSRMKEHYTIIDIFKNRTLRCTTLVLFYAWIVNALVYFGLTLTSSKLAGDRFLNFFLMSIVEIPAAIITFFSMKWPGRRMTCIIFHALAGIALIIAACLNGFVGKSTAPFVTGLSIFGKFAIASSWGTFFTYTTELYPTNARSIGLGISSSASRIGGMIAPFSNLVMDELAWVPGTVFGICSLAVCFLMFLVPETRDKELPQTMEEINEWNHKTHCPCARNT